MLLRSLSLLCCLTATTGLCKAQSATTACQRQDLFVGGTEGYQTYRIPAIAACKSGTLLAFCEGRKEGQSDTGRIDLILKRSTDSGKTWTKQQAVWSDGKNTCGNPCPVVDQQTGAVWLLMTWNRGDDREQDIVAGTSKDTRRVFVTSSNDDGANWTVPKEITANVKAADWTWYATGPGNGIQLTRGSHKNRLVIPCDHIEAGTKKYYSHVIYSDDHGAAWQCGGSSPHDGTNECAVVELNDGRLMLNMRNSSNKKTRQVCISRDGGAVWESQHHDATLVEPICQASLLRYSWPGQERKSRIIFSNPADEQRRINLTLRVSEDEATTWAISRSLGPEPAAYSSLAVSNGFVACLYETGKHQPYEKIVLAVLSLDWLTQGGTK